MRGRPPIHPLEIGLLLAGAGWVLGWALVGPGRWLAADLTAAAGRLTGAFLPAGVAGQPVLPTETVMPPFDAMFLQAFAGWVLILLLLVACVKWIPGRTTVIYRPYGYRSDVWFRLRPEWLEAERRAEALLRDVVTPEEYQRLVQLGYLEVPSRLKAGRTYRIPYQSGRVRVYEHGKPVIELCVQPREQMPDGDLVVMHKLMIEGNEREYLKVANTFGCYDGRPVRHSTL